MAGAGDGSIVLMVDDLFPSPKFGYGLPRSRAIVECVAARRNLVLFETAGDVREAGAAAELGGAVRIFSPSKDKVAEVLRGLLATMPVGDTFVWVSRPRNLAKVLDALDGVAARPAVLYDAESLYYRRRREQSAAYPILDIAGKVENEEIEEIVRIAQADVVTSVSHDEWAILHEALDLPIIRLGHRHDLVPTPAPWAERRNILLLGGFSGVENGLWSAPIAYRSGNQDAAMFFLSEVLPILEAQNGDLRVEIAGFRSELLHDWPPVERSERVSILGSVEDVTTLYDSALCVVAPTRIAAGLAWKATEALSFGVPIVATPLIADQLGPGGREVVLTADEPAGFAENILNLARDESLWARQRSRGLRYVEEWQSPAVFEEATGRALAAVDEILAGRRSFAH